MKNFASIPDAWIVFIGTAELAWQKLLKPGFRHCCLLLNDGERWISFDPMSNYTDIHVHKLPVEFDLPLWLRDHGHIVVKTKIARAKNEAPWMPYSCVEAVKRVIGLHARSIITPWQLYRHIIKTNEKEGEHSWQD